MPQKHFGLGELEHGLRPAFPDGFVQAAVDLHEAPDGKGRQGPDRIERQRGPLDTAVIRGVDPRPAGSGNGNPIGIDSVDARPQEEQFHSQRHLENAVDGRFVQLVAAGARLQRVCLFAGGAGEVQPERAVGVAAVAHGAEVQRNTAHARRSALRPLKTAQSSFNRRSAGASAMLVRIGIMQSQWLRDSEQIRSPSAAVMLTPLIWLPQLTGTQRLPAKLKMP